VAWSRTLPHPSSGFVHASELSRIALASRVFHSCHMPGLHIVLISLLQTRSSMLHTDPLIVGWLFPKMGRELAHFPCNRGVVSAVAIANSL
jgi:hypothetical protein